jgi:hypothetical protein
MCELWLSGWVQKKQKQNQNQKQKLRAGRPRYMGF